MLAIATGIGVFGYQAADGGLSASLRPSGGVLVLSFLHGRGRLFALRDRVSYDRLLFAAAAVLSWVLLFARRETRTISRRCLGRLLHGLAPACLTRGAFSCSRERTTPTAFISTASRCNVDDRLPCFPAPESRVGQRGRQPDRRLCLCRLVMACRRKTRAGASASPAGSACKTHGRRPRRSRAAHIASNATEQADTSQPSRSSGTLVRVRLNAPRPAGASNDTSRNGSVGFTAKAGSTCQPGK